ncbi:hypothetical protein PsorP6_005471 [Peronosclerospora sorghi]|uniref:Uncharacterized protein n=1 Tax=Peronosclerospora sorghi TaxID=230839 RepID=A0ACC0W385_9STRA|nr:hypothetical protein PsorP6_005471 [Peronosclerospora sorghi]
MADDEQSTSWRTELVPVVDKCLGELLSVLNLAQRIYRRVEIDLANSDDDLDRMIAQYQKYLDAVTHSRPSDSRQDDEKETGVSIATVTFEQLVLGEKFAAVSFQAKEDRFMLKCHLITKDEFTQGDVNSGTTVAVKKVTNAFHDLPDTKRILRELCLLRHLKHPNLIQLYDIPRPSRLSFIEDIYIVTDLMEMDLHRVIHSTQTLTDKHVDHFMRQILRGLAF